MNKKSKLNLYWTTYAGMISLEHTLERLSGNILNNINKSEGLNQGGNEDPITLT